LLASSKSAFRLTRTNSQTMLQLLSVGVSIRLAHLPNSPVSSPSCSPRGQSFCDSTDSERDKTGIRFDAGYTSTQISI
jgi:hypothetical protein